MGPLSLLAIAFASAGASDSLPCADTGPQPALVRQPTVLITPNDIVDAERRMVLFLWGSKPPPGAPADARPTVTDGYILHHPAVFPTPPGMSEAEHLLLPASLRTWGSGWQQAFHCGDVMASEGGRIQSYAELWWVGNPDALRDLDRDPTTASVEDYQRAVIDESRLDPDVEPIRIATGDLTYHASFTVVYGGSGDDVAEDYARLAMEILAIESATGEMRLTEAGSGVKREAGVSAEPGQTVRVHALEAGAWVKEPLPKGWPADQPWPLRSEGMHDMESSYILLIP